MGLSWTTCRCPCTFQKLLLKTSWLVYLENFRSWKSFELDHACLWDKNSYKTQKMIRLILTYFFKHLVALINDKHSKVVEYKIFLWDHCLNSSWCTDDNMWRIHSLHDFCMLTIWHSTKEYFFPDIWKMCRESIKFLFDLVSQLSCIAKNQSWCWFDLLISTI